jgi:outer membrane biosynthesis protein TonB
MRRFFFLSLFLHGIALMLLFSWEIPEAGKLPARNIIQVSLIDKGEDETPPPKAEKAAEKPKGEKRIAKKDPPPLSEPKETAKEIGKENSKEEKIQKEEETQVEPASPPNQSGPLPGPLTAEISQPLGNRAVEDAKGAGEEKKKPGAQERGGAFLAIWPNPGAGKEEIPSGGGEQQASVLGGSDRNL